MKLSDRQLSKVDEFVRQAESVVDSDVIYLKSDNIEQLEEDLTAILEDLGVDAKKYFKRLV